MSLVPFAMPLFAQAQAEAPLMPPLAWGPLLGIAAGLVVLGLLLAGLRNPQAWIIVSVLAISLGTGAALYGLVLYNSGQPIEEIVERASIAIGAGAGGAVGGFVLLLVAVLRMRMNAEKRP